MYPAPIAEYEVPVTVDGALAALRDGGESTSCCIAGGMSLMQALTSRLIRVDRLVDLSAIKELVGVRSTTDAVVIGAMTRYADLAVEPKLTGAYQALMDAAAHVGDRQVRNRGTLGGSLCWNYPAACCPPTVMALGATIALSRLDTSGRRQDRMLASEAFLLGPLTTLREEGELLTAIHLPLAKPRTASAYKKWGLVSDALPVVGIAVSLSLDARGAIAACTVAFGGLNCGPVRVQSVERALVGAPSSDDPRIERAFRTAALQIEAHTDLWASADYRRHLIGEIGPQTVAIAWTRAQGEQPA